MACTASSIELRPTSPGWKANADRDDEAKALSRRTINTVNLTPNEVLIIALVALVVLGPQRLPEAARQIGKGYRELRKMSTSVRAEIDTALKEPVEAITNPINEIKGSLQDTLKGTDDPATDAGSASSSTSRDSLTPEVPNSAYRPADELGLDDAAPDGAANDGDAEPK